MVTSVSSLVIKALITCSTHTHTVRLTSVQSDAMSIKWESRDLERI